MGNYEQLKQSVSDVIKTNGNQEITGSILQNVLLTIISTVGANATFVGVATPATNPGTPDGSVFYLASESGTYSNFGSIELQDGLSVLMWNGSWSSQQILSIDTEPTAGSNNLVKSGGVQQELALGAVYDVSAKNPTAGPNNDGKFESLSALLEDANLNTLIPTAVRKGGMSIKFIQSSDNKYVRYNYLLEDATTNSKFVNVANWQGVDKEISAIIGNKNVAETNGIVNLLGRCLKKTYGFDRSNEYYKSDNTIVPTNWFGYFKVNVTPEIKKVICNVCTVDVANYCFDENGNLLSSKQYRPTADTGGPYFYEFDIPSGTSYIVFNNFFYDGVDYHNFIGNPNPVIIIDGILIDSFRAKKLKEDAEMVLTKEGFVELAVTANILSNKFIGGDNGMIQYHDGWNMYLIPAKPETTYSIKPSRTIEVDHALFILNSYKKALVGYGSVVSGISQDVPAANEYGYIEITTPANAAYIACNITNSSTTNWNIFEGVGEYTPENIIKIGGIPLKSSYDDTLSERIGDIEEELSNLDTTRFANKKIVVLGDSITHLGIITPAKGWTTYFLPSLGFKTTNFKNYARSGATWSNTANTQYDITEYTGSLSDDNVIYNQVNRLLADLNNNVIAAPDYIIILAGTNDALYPNARPDATSKTADEVFSNETAWYLNSKPISECTSIAEAIRYVSEMISTNIPTAQVIVTTPLQSTAIAYARNELVSGIIEGCAKYLSWNVVNQSKECSVSRIEERHANYKTYDGTHPSEIGAACIGHTLAAIMNAILRY